MKTGKLLLTVLLLSLPFVVQAEPFWGAKASSPADTLPEALQQGEFVWESQAQTKGPIAIVVSLPEQRAFVYRNGVRIGYTTVSTGKKGHRTPTGVFIILNKDRHHHSKTYNNAAMPYSQRLTWGGIALHAGGLPGYPSSHGCVHLPTVFAKDLFKITSKGMTVVIADKASAPRDVTHPAMLAPVDASGEPVEEEHLSAGEKFEWHPEKSPEGPVSILVSGADQKALIFRNGVEIGLAKVKVKNPEQPLGTHAYLAISGNDTAAVKWKAVGLPRHTGEDRVESELQTIDRIKLPQRLISAFKPLLTPGVTMMITDAPIHQHTTGAQFEVVMADHSGEGLPTDIF